MPILRITNGFDQLSNPDLLTRASYIKGKMFGNPNFPTPNPTLNDLGTTINSFQEAIFNAGTGDTHAKAVLKEIRGILINQLHLMGNYVLFMSAGNVVMAESSGYHTGKTPEPSAPMGNPQHFYIKTGANPGELVLGCDAVPSAKAYIFEYTAGPVTEASVWSTQTSTRSKIVLTGLQAGVVYTCRVAAIGPREQKMYSEVLSRMVI